MCSTSPPTTPPASCTEAINNVALNAGVPIVCGEEGLCAGCGVATLSIDYYDLGYATGEMAYEILVNGADVSTMEVRVRAPVHQGVQCRQLPGAQYHRP